MRLYLQRVYALIVSSGSCCSHVSDERLLNHWIGLHRGDLGCRCYLLDAECIVCRESWLWSDGTPANSFDSWAADNLPDFKNAGYLSADGWGSELDSVRQQFICEKFNRNTFHFQNFKQSQIICLLVV